MKEIQLASVLLPLNKVATLLSFYEHEAISSPNEYVQFAAKHDGITILLYHKEHAGFQKVVFQGPEALNEAKLWGEVTKLSTLAKNKEEIPETWFNLEAQIGADEVGTGDFFGPIVVCAAYFGDKQRDLLKQTTIGDSKLLTDDTIRKIVPSLLKKVPYSLLIVTNEKYNTLVSEGYNINKIKAWLHQTALTNMDKKYRGKVPLYLDQFCTPSLFKKYTVGHSSAPLSINFATKAEQKYPSVAIASMIARYALLNYMDKLNKKHRQIFPLGAGAKVDQVTTMLVNEKGLDFIKPLVKQNFKNYRKLTEMTLPL